MHENAYKSSASIYATELQTHSEAVTSSSEEIPSGDQQETFHSSNSNEDPQYLEGQDREIFSYGDRHNVPGHVANVDEEPGLSHEIDENEMRVTSKPIAVSESGDNDDDNDQLLLTHDSYANSAMLMVNQFTIAGIYSYAIQLKLCIENVNIL